MKRTITITILCVLYYIVPFIISTVCLSGSVTVFIILGFEIFKSAAGLFFIPLMLCASFWALHHTYQEIKQMCLTNLATE